MNKEFLALFEASKTLVTYIDEKYVFDKAAAGGCSGMDYHLSDTFYDLIVNAKKTIDEVENGQKDAGTDGKSNLKLLESAKALVNHIQKEPAFDKVNDMGPVGIETFQSDAFIEIIQSTNKAIQEAENGLL